MKATSMDSSTLNQDIQAENGSSKGAEAETGLDFDHTPGSEHIPDFEHDLDLYFLGPKSEQRQFLSEALHLVLNDHVFWRRNYYPKDPPAIGYSKVNGADASHFKEQFFTELFSLVSDLKLDVPVFSPRYMAHMISETTLPSLVAYFATLLYNPNNVSSEASPVTIRYELEVGKQFARLFGFDEDRSFGHLTSGGSVANYESLWFVKAGRYLAVSIEMARRENDGVSGETGADELFRLMNFSLEDSEILLNEFLSVGQDPEARWAELEPHLVSHLGEHRFIRQVEAIFQTEWVEPVVVVPRTAHYSWKRSASLLGIGRDNYLTVDVDEEFRMSASDLENVLVRCIENRQPVLQMAAVLGTTEFGSVDPLEQLVDVRDAMFERGLFAAVHVDAAYGGYFATMFRNGESGFNPLDESDEWIQRAFDAVRRVDSITVDPHKAGYIPYGAGSIILKNGFLKDLVAESAAYCLDREDTNRESDPAPQLGKFILEGSKPGAVAASVWFSHRLIPLNREGYGRQLSILCRIARDFERLTSKRSGVHSLFRPHTNIVCLFADPGGAKSLSELNNLNEHLGRRFGVRDVLSIQNYDYLVSRTTVEVDMPFVQNHPLLSKLEHDADELTVLRLVFMNRWVEAKEAGGKSYLTDFLDLLESEIKAH